MNSRFDRDRLDRLINGENFVSIALWVVVIAATVAWVLGAR